MNIFSCKCLELNHLWQLAEHPKIFVFKLVCAVELLGWGKIYAVVIVGSLSPCLILSSFTCISSNSDMVVYAKKSMYQMSLSMKKLFSIEDLCVSLVGSSILVEIVYGFEHFSAVLEEHTSEI